MRGIRPSILVGIVLAAVLLGGCSPHVLTKVRVLTYNIHHGEGMDGSIELERIAAVIRKADADLVALQEVDRGVARTARVDQPAALARLTGMHVVFEKNADMQGGDYGNAILSRWPIAKQRNHWLPRIGDNEQRGLLETQVQFANWQVTFLATHLDHQHDDAERMASIAVIRERVEAQPADVVVILAGDLNAEPDSRVIQEVGAFLHDSVAAETSASFTYPADAPERRIDYILYRTHPGLQLTISRVLPEATASDHRPVVTEFRICARRGAHRR